MEQRPAVGSSDWLGSFYSLERYEAFFRENPTMVIQFADLGLHGKDKEDYIKHLRSLPNAHPSDLILLDKSDVPASLEGHFEFGRGQDRFCAPL